MTYSSSFDLMALKGNSSEINKKISKSGIASLLKYFVFGLVVIYTFVELNVSPILIDFLTKEEKHELIVAAIRVTNLRDVLSSIFSIVVFPITEAFTGYFAMITVCTAANISGLVLLWTSTSPSAHVEVYAAIFLLALGKSGQKLSEKFFEYQLQETIKAKEESEVELGSQQNQKEQGRVGKHIWLIVQLFFSYSIIIVHVAFINPDGDYKERFLFCALLMLVLNVLFVICYCGWYSRKELAAETVSYGVREVKSLVPIICICFTFVAYSLTLASGNTFFVVQARRLTPFTKSIGNDICSLFLIKSVGKTMSKYTCMGLSFVFGRFRKFKDFDARSKRKAGTITKTCCGMVCAVICSLISMLVVLIIQPHKTVDLVPQFFLLGITEGLVGEGFANLLHDHVPTWMRSFEDSISELMIGTGKIIVLIICILFKDAVNPSHLGRFYLVLAILNAAFLLVYACISIKYAYKEECQQDEEATVEKTLELQVHQPDSEDSYQENNSGTQPVGQEEERLKHEVPESAHMVTRNKGNGRKGNGVPGVRKTVQMKRNGNKMNCFFCKKVGHMKKDCLKYKKWLKKKGLSKPVKSSRK